MRQAPDAHRAQLRAIGKVNAQARCSAATDRRRTCRCSGRCRQRQAHIAIEHAQRRVVARDHDRAAGVPLAARVQQAGALQRALHRAVQAGSAPLAVPHRTQHPKALERGQHTQHPGAVLGRIRMGRALRQQFQVGAVAGRSTRAALDRQLQHGGRAGTFLAVQRAAGVVLEQMACGNGVARIHGARQLPDRATKTPAVPQHDGVLGQHGCCTTALLQKRHRQRLASGCQCVICSLRAVTTGFGVAAQVAQHRASFHRSQLVLVAQQHQAGGGRQRGQQGGHHFQVHHGSFVHDQHVHVQRVAGVVAKLARVGPGAQQRVQRARCTHALRERRQIERAAQPLVQAAERCINGLLEPRRRFSGGRGQCHAQALGRCIDRKQQCQQPRSGVGFAGARPAGDDRQAPAHGNGAGHLLPVRCVLLPLGHGGHGRPLVRGKQALHPGAQGVCAGVGVGGQCGVGGALQHLLRHSAFVAPIAAQVQQGRSGSAAQYQRLAHVGVMAGGMHHATGLQRRMPPSQRHRQA